MRPWRLALFPAASSKRARRPAATVRPRLEALEERLTPTLTYHGGATLAAVQAQSVYLGAGWDSLASQTSQFDGFLNTLVAGTAAAPSSYLALLKNAGFAGVTGAGGASAGFTDNALAAAVSAQTVYDSQIQAYLAADISSGAVQQPNASTTLYIAYVEPNVVVSFPNGQNSVNTFLAYHSSFTSNGQLVRYAVVPYHGTGGNAQDPWLTSAFDSMTVAASHETAEAVTDPDGTAYFDRSGNEIGDVVNGSTAYITNAATGAQYAVQREGSVPASVTNFLPMTPAGATAAHPSTFAVQGGALVVDGAAVANPSGETGQVRAVSAQSIDDFGQPMVAVVFTDGRAYEYHDFPAGNPTATSNPSFFPWTSLGSNVKQAATGQAVSYVLFANGNLEEYVDPNYATYYYGYGVNPGSSRGVIASGVTGVTAVGLDTLGVNAVVYTKTVGGAPTSFEWRDVTGTSTKTSGNPTGGLHHSEIPTTLGNGPANPPTQTVDAVFLNALSSPATATASPAAPATGQTTLPTRAPAAVPVLAAPFHAGFADGGGGALGDVPQRTGSPAPAAEAGGPAAVADLPLLGRLFTEAVRRLQEVRFAVPADMWQAAPSQPEAPTAPTHGRPPAAPQGKAGDRGSWLTLGAYALPVAAGFCGAGIEHEVRRRRERLLKRAD